MDSDSPLAVDFSVVHPLRPSEDLAEVHPGKLLRQKSCNQFDVCQKTGWGFCPFVDETRGTWGGLARHLLQHLLSLGRKEGLL